MKTKWIVTGIIGLMLQAAAFAQNNSRVSPEWVSEKGWWMVESNIHSPKKHIVYFYNNEGVLVYKEKIEGIRLKPTRRTTQMRLKQVLETSVQTWEKQHKLVENESFVLNSLKGK